MLQKTAIVTGATSGIGLETVKQLLGKGFFVLATGRDSQKCVAAQNIFKGEFKDNILYLTCDQSDLKKVKQLAYDMMDELRRRGFSCIDVLINNAGIFASSYELTADGFETQFAVNYLSAFLLTHLLLPKLKKSEDARIIFLGSKSHYNTNFTLSKLNTKERTLGLMSYKRSKLALAMLTHSLNLRYGNARLHAYCADPGLVKTYIGCKVESPAVALFWKIRRKFGVRVSKGAETTVFLASNKISPDTKPYFYYYQCRQKRPNSAALKQGNCLNLYAWTAELCKKYMYTDEE